MLYALRYINTNGIVATGAAVYNVGKSLFGLTAGAATAVAAFDSISGFIRNERGFKEGARLLAKQFPEIGAKDGELIGDAVGSVIDAMTGYNTTSTLVQWGGLLGTAPGTIISYSLNTLGNAVDTVYAYTFGLDPRLEYAYQFLTDMGPKYAAEIALYLSAGNYKNAAMKSFGTLTLLAALSYDNAVPQHTLNVVERVFAEQMALKNVTISAEAVQATIANHNELYTGAGLDYYLPHGALDSAGRVLVQSTFDLGLDLFMFAMNPGSINMLAYSLVFQFTRIGELMAKGHNKQLAIIKAEAEALGKEFMDTELASFLNKAGQIVQKCTPLTAAEASMLALEINFFAGNPADPKLELNADCTDELLTLLASDNVVNMLSEEKPGRDEL